MEPSRWARAKARYVILWRKFLVATKIRVVRLSEDLTAESTRVFGSASFFFSSARNADYCPRRSQAAHMNLHIWQTIRHAHSYRSKLSNLCKNAYGYKFQMVAAIAYQPVIMVGPCHLGCHWYRFYLEALSQDYILRYVVSTRSLLVLRP